MENKSCTKCNETQPISSFYKKNSWCKTCFKEYYSLNKDKVLKRQSSSKGKKINNKAVNKIFHSIPPGVYMIKNIITGDFYIGQSVRPYVRMSQHLNKNYHTSSVPKVYEAVKQYGKQNFITGIIEHCDKHLLLEKENYYINLLNPKYNIKS